MYVLVMEVNVPSIPPTFDLNVFFSPTPRLDAVDPNAYDAFKASRNLGDVIDRVLRNQQEASNGSGPRKLLTVEASLMTPVQPMLVSRFAILRLKKKKSIRSGNYYGRGTLLVASSSGEMSLIKPSTLQSLGSSSLCCL